MTCSSLKLRRLPEEVDVKAARSHEPRMVGLLVIGLMGCLLGCEPRIMIDERLRFQAAAPVHLEAQITPFQTEIRRVTVRHDAQVGEPALQPLHLGGELWAVDLPMSVLLRHGTKIAYTWEVEYGTAGRTGTTTRDDVTWLTTPNPSQISPSYGAEGVGSLQGARFGVDFRWFAVAGAQSYRLRVLSGATDNPARQHLEVELPGLTQTEARADLDRERYYYWTVEAEFEHRGVSYRGPATPEWRFSTLTPVPRPAPPTDLVVSAISSSEISLTWRDNATDEIGFVIEHSTNGVDWNSSYGVINSADVQAASDINLTPATEHLYRVRARNAAGTSTPSNVASAITLPTGPPSAPRNLQALPGASTSILLTWENTSPNQGYEVFEAVGAADFPALPSGAVLEANVIGAHVYGLTPGLSYRYQVRAKNSFGVSALSNIASITLPRGGGEVQTGSRFLDLAAYPIISLVLDGTQRISVPGTGIPSCGQQAACPGAFFALAPGAHSYEAATGHWRDGQRQVMYTYRGTLQQAAGMAGEVRINNPTIQQLLAGFPVNSHGYWVGAYWSGTLLNSRAFRFFQDGTFARFDNGAQVGGGTYTLVSYPGSYLVTFVAAGVQGVLDERSGSFYMRNGPPDWPVISYSNDGQ